MPDYVGTWGCCSWFPNPGKDKLYPGSLQTASELLPSDRIFACVGEEGDFVSLQHPRGKFGVLARYYYEQNAPRFVFGDVVRIKDHPDCVGTLQDIQLHVNKGKPMYFVEVDGKKLSKRYWDEDLELVSRKPLFSE